jgi:hypothetical protein
LLDVMASTTSASDLVLQEEVTKMRAQIARLGADSAAVMNRMNAAPVPTPLSTAAPQPAPAPMIYLVPQGMGGPSSATYMQMPPPQYYGAMPAAGPGAPRKVVMKKKAPSEAIGCVCCPSRESCNGFWRFVIGMGMSLLLAALFSNVAELLLSPVWTWFIR